MTRQTERGTVQKSDDLTDREREYRKVTARQTGRGTVQKSDG
jgi:hypothetical protein